eukprot:360146-Chlamydomonas_euryale.AAC.3
MEDGRRGFRLPGINMGSYFDPLNSPLESFSRPLLASRAAFGAKKLKSGKRGHEGQSFRRIYTKHQFVSICHLSAFAPIPPIGDLYIYI